VVSAPLRRSRARAILGRVGSLLMVGGVAVGCNAILGIDDHEPLEGDGQAGEGIDAAPAVDVPDGDHPVAHPEAGQTPAPDATAIEAGPCGSACTDGPVSMDTSAPTDARLDSPADSTPADVSAADVAAADVVEEPCASGYGTACGKCGGTVRCDGTCSVSTPAAFGQTCGSCGGVIGCSGACTVSTPATFGQACGSCGGKVQCDSTCSVSTPANFGQACNSGCGSINCSAVCSSPPNASTFGGLCPSSTGTAIANGGIYGNYQVKMVTLNGAIPGVYTFSITSGDAGVVTLLRDGVAATTLSYVWQTTVSGPGANPVLTYSFNFPNYFNVTILAALATPVGTINLFDLNANSIFDGAHYLSICCQ
jgi:hypothetical protein